MSKETVHSESGVNPKFSIWDETATNGPSIKPERRQHGRYVIDHRNVSRQHAFKLFTVRTHHLFSLSARPQIWYFSNSMEASPG